MDKVYSYQTSSTQSLQSDVFIPSVNELQEPKVSSSDLTKEQKAIVNRVDWRLLPFVFILYFFAYLDRTNIANVHDPLLEDLELSEEQYGMAIGVFYIGYILFEIPANLIQKKLSAPLWLGILTFGWGICALAMLLVHDFGSLLAVRACLGIAEAGFFPGVIMYLSSWYIPEEMSFRTAVFYCASAVAGVASGLIASAVLQLDDVGGLEGWKWMFLLEGLPCLGLGIATYFVLPANPQKAKFLTQEERDYIQDRLTHLPKDHYTTKVKSEDITSTLLSPSVWIVSFLFLAVSIPSFAKSFYAPTLIADLGYTTTEANLLSSALSFFGLIMIISVGWHAAKKKERFYHLLFPLVLSLCGWIGLTLATTYEQDGLSYAMMFLCFSQSACLPIILSWINSLFKGSTKLATATALLISIGNTGGIIGPNIYGFLFIEDPDNPDEGSYFYAHLSMVISLVIGLILLLITARFYPAKSFEEISAENEPLLKDSQRIIN